MKRPLLLWSSVLLVFAVYGCLVTGHRYEPRDTPIVEPGFSMSVSAHPDFLSIFVLTKFNAPHIITDSAHTVHFIRIVPHFTNGDTLVRDTTETTSFIYRHPRHQKITAEKQLLLTVEYSIDSAGTSVLQKRQYELYRKRHFWFAVH